MKRSAKQLYCLLVKNTVSKKRRKASKHRSMENVSRLSTSPTQLDGTQQCLLESCNLADILEVQHTRSWTNRLSENDESKDTKAKVLNFLLMA